MPKLSGRLVDPGLSKSTVLGRIDGAARCVEPFLEAWGIHVGNPHSDLAQSLRLFPSAIGAELVGLDGACLVHPLKVARYR